MVIYTEFLYVSVRGIILSIKYETILHTTTQRQLMTLNTCVLHHGYIYRISVCFIIGIILSIKLETILHTTTHGQLTSLNICVLHHGYIYRISVCFRSRYNSEYQTRNYIAYYDTRPVNVSKYMSITPWLYIQNFCMFHYRYNFEYQTRNYIACYDSRSVNVSKHMSITPHCKFFGAILAPKMGPNV